MERLLQVVVNLKCKVEKRKVVNQYLKVKILIMYLNSPGAKIGDIKEQTT